MNFADILRNKLHYHLYSELRSKLSNQLNEHDQGNRQINLFVHSLYSQQLTIRGEIILYSESS